MTITGSIKSLTNDGHTVAQFLVNTMEGQTDGVKVHHRLDAAKQLIKYGFSEDDSNFWGLIPTPEELASRSRDMEPRRELPKRKVTYLDILNFDIARQIRDETDDGHLMIEFPRQGDARTAATIHRQKTAHQARRQDGGSEGTAQQGLRQLRFIAFAPVRKEGRLRHDPRRHLAAHPTAHRVRQRHNPLPARCDGRTAAR